MSDEKTDIKNNEDLLGTEENDDGSPVLSRARHLDVDAVLARSLAKVASE